MRRSSDPGPSFFEFRPTRVSGGHWIRLLSSIIRSYPLKISTTYGLFNLENLLRVAQPFALGRAIDDLLAIAPSFGGLALMAGLYLAHLLISSLRQMYDTRVFTTIYTELATRLVLGQRGDGVDISSVAARSVMSREFVDFLERSVPLSMRSIYSLVGALVMLALYDRMLVPICLMLVLPMAIINSIYANITFNYSSRLHDELEREVEVIGSCTRDEVYDHYGRIARWRIKLSDSEAINTGVSEIFILGVMAASLVRSCELPTAAGSIFGVFRYTMMFIMGMDGVPMIVQQGSRLMDIGRRINRETVCIKCDPSIYRERPETEMGAMSPGNLADVIPVDHSDMGETS
jgi:hypothetical protein